VIVEVLPVHDEEFSTGTPVPSRRLICLVSFVFDGGAAARERIKMILAEIFLLKLWRGGRFHCNAILRSFITHPALRKTVQISGHELQSGIVEGGAAVVDDGDPASRSAALSSATDGKNVVGVPGKVAGEEIGRFDFLFGGPGIFKRHQQRRPLIEIRRHFGEAISSRCNHR